MPSESDKLVCVERELRLRRRVYPRRIESGSMSREAAMREIEMMEAIVEDYRERAERERLL